MINSVDTFKFQPLFFEKMPHVAFFNLYWNFYMLNCSLIKNKEKGTLKVHHNDRHWTETNSWATLRLT